MGFYEDDRRVGEVTRALVSAGISILQLHKLAADDRGHVAELLALFDPPSNATVLDAGCGVGKVSELMSDLRPDLRFILLNISGAQLDLCPPQFERMRGSFESIPLDDASVDGVMLNYALGHGDLDKSMIEAARVLTSRGLMFIYDLWAENPEPMQTTLEYTPHHPLSVMRAARLAGFVQGWSRGIYGTTKTGLDIATEEQRKAFATTSPIVYRFSKDLRTNDRIIPFSLDFSKHD